VVWGVAIAAVAVITPASVYEVLPSHVSATAPAVFGQASPQTPVNFDGLWQLSTLIGRLHCESA